MGEMRRRKTAGRQCGGQGCCHRQATLCCWEGLQQVLMCLYVRTWSISLPLSVQPWLPHPVVGCINMVMNMAHACVNAHAVPDCAFNLTRHKVLHSISGFQWYITT